MNYNMTVESCKTAAEDGMRFVAYRDLSLALKPFFAEFISAYCRNCQKVIARLPEADAEAIGAVEGIYPGCCHRGAGDIFRLEGEPGARSRLAPEIIAELQKQRRLRLARSEAPGGGFYRYFRLRDKVWVSGAHCSYFAADGCLLGELKGPLCLNFICPPIRDDLLQVAVGRENLIGPEHDFLLIYRSMAVISYDRPEAVAETLVEVKRNILTLTRLCRKFLDRYAAVSLCEYFQRQTQAQGRCP
ncbi:MAG: hypothetical protein JXR89_12775 [Deltaproteobacteria bacterium]|nr:hypothetical protein [Deltaproteobacteria bacterium]